MLDVGKKYLRIHYVKYARIRIFTDRILPYKDRITDSVLIRENTVSQNPDSRIIYTVILTEFWRIKAENFVQKVTA